MNRLTKFEFGKHWWKDNAILYDEDGDSKGVDTKKVLYELAHYEDLKEQGRLVEMPFAPGTTVYVIDGFPEPMALKAEMTLSLMECYEDIFQTKKDAEERLVELEEKE